MVALKRNSTTILFRKKNTGPVNTHKKYIVIVRCLEEKDSKKQPSHFLPILCMFHELKFPEQEKRLK